MRVLLALLAIAGCDGVWGIDSFKQRKPMADAPAADARAGYPSAVIADSPISYWRFGERSTQIAIDQMGRNMGTYGGGAQPTSTGAILSDPDSSLQLDGIDDFVSM